MPARPTLADRLARAAGSADTGLRVLDRRGEPTWMPWPVVLERARRVCGGLQALGVGPGDRVALIFPTCPGFFDAFFGAVLAGAVPVPLYPPVRLGRLDEYHERTSRMLGAAGVRVILAEPGVRRILGETVSRAKPPLGCRALADLPESPARAVRTEPDALGLVQFSSGTTRAPRGVGLTQAALVEHAEMLNGFWPERPGVHHNGVSWLPLYHDMGLIGCVLTALVRPGTLTLIPPETFIARPAIWLQTISRYAATISPSPNFGYALCVQRIKDEELDHVDLSSWWAALNGAETAVPSVMRAFQRRFARWGFAPEALTPVYGLSEAALAVTFGEIGRGFTAARFDRERLSGAGLAFEVPDGREIASVGRPVPGVEVRVVGRDEKPLGEGLVGAVECRGPSVMREYVGQPDATAQALRGGWLNTGDLGFWWKGELFLTGRAKDVLLLRGRNYAPEEVEQVVEGVHGIRPGCTVAVTWLPEDADSERLLVLAEARRDLPASTFPEAASASRDAILSHLGLAADVVLLPPGTLPRTSSGKLQRQEALQRYLSGTLAAPLPVTRLRLAAALTRSSLAFLRTRLG